MCNDELKTYYYIQEYSPGVSLSTAIKNGLSPEQFIKIVCDICESLQAVAVLGVHGDLHAGNILLAKENDSDSFSVKIIDFGVCNLNNLLKGYEGVPVVEDKFRHRGAMSCWSPEHLQNPENTCGEHDVWAIGVILYKYFCNEWPFKSDTFGEYYDQIRQGRKAIADLEDHLLKRIIELCLSALRPNARQLLIMLMDYKEGRTANISSTDVEKYFEFHGEAVVCANCALVQAKFNRCGKCNLEDRPDKFAWKQYLSGRERQGIEYSG